MLNLEEALDLARRTKAFAVNRHDGMVLVSYLFHEVELFRRESLAKELRGAVWEESTGELLSRPFPKFYNLGEPLAPRLEGPMGSALLAPKVDGFLVQAFLRGEKVVTASRQSLTMGLIRPLLEEFWTEAHEGFAVEVSEALGGATLLFELVHPQAKILQEGQRPGLRFLAARTLAEGKLLVCLSPEAGEALGEDPRDLGRLVAPPRGVEAVLWDLPERVFGREGVTWEEALRAVRSWELRERGWESLEGAVALTGEGEMVKLKTPWAFWVAALLMEPTKTLLKALAEERLDDLLALLAGTREDLRQVALGVAEEVGRQVREGAALGEAWRGKERRAFWEAVQGRFSRPHEILAQRAAVMAYEGRPLEAVWAEVRGLLGRKPTWERFASWLEEAHGEALRKARPKEALAELRG